MQSSECETCGSSVGGLVVVATGYEVRHGRGVLAVSSAWEEMGARRAPRPQLAMTVPMTIAAA